MKDRIVPLSAIALILFQIFLAYPIAVWLRNKENFEAGLTSSYSILFVALVSILTLSVLLTILCPKKVLTKILPHLVLISAALFIQQNFLAWDYGILDGAELDFAKNNAIGLVDVGLWLSVILAGFFVGKVVLKFARNLLLAVGLTSVIFTVMNLANYGKYDQNHTITEVHKFDFSKKKNVILFMFDAFQMDQLLEIFDQNPEFEEAFSGFTLYENNAAVFAKTYPSVPLFLAGERYKKKEPILDFFDRVYDDSLMTDLQAAKWDVGLYPETTIYPSVINAVKLDPTVTDNIVGGTPFSNKITAYRRALNLSLFRSVPHQLKPVVFNQGHFLVDRRVSNVLSNLVEDEVFEYDNDSQHHALLFDKHLRENGQAIIETPAFRFFHLAMPHSPFTLDVDLNEVKPVQNFSRFQDYSFAATRLMISYLESLKTIGVYDDAAIVILSDHGKGFSHKKQYDSQKKTYFNLKRFGYQRSAAKSILLIKKPGEKFALRRSHKPTSGVDVAPTMASMAGMPVERYEGFPVDEIAEDANRQRLYNYYKFTTWDSKYLNDFARFKIEGDIRLNSSWAPAGKHSDPEKIKNKEKYSFGEVLSYGVDAKNDSDFLNAFIQLDDYKAEANFIVSSDGTLDIDLDFADPPSVNDKLLLQFEIYIGDTVKRTVKINDVSISRRMRPTKRALNKGIIITPEMHKGMDTMKISFSMGKNVPPTRLNFSTLKITKISDNK